YLRRAHRLPTGRLRMVPRLRGAAPGTDVDPGLQPHGAVRRAAGTGGPRGPDHRAGAPRAGDPGMTNPIGPLTPEDEGFNHQIIDTFAVVGSSDLAWTEKVCAMAAARDGSP